MDNQNQINSEADVVQPTITKSVNNNKEVLLTNKPYISKAIPKIIKFNSRASVKIVNNGEHYYTIEYGEERQIDNFNEVDMDKERQTLVDDCNQVVDKQIEEIVKTFLK